MGLFLICFAVVLFAIGLPIAFVLGLIPLAHMVLNGDTTFLNIIPQRMFAALDNFNMMAVPFFLLAGELMNFGGVTKRLINFSRTLVGHLKGGLGYVTIVTAGMLAALMGVAQGVAAALSPIMVPAMVEDGYKREDATAIVAAASITGPIIPPSLVFILYGVAASVSIGALFMAGVIPGILLISAFSILNFYFARKKGIAATRQRATLKELGTSFVKALPCLSVPVIMFVGIIGGFCTPTEAAAIACLVAFILGTCVYKELKMKDIYKIFLNTCVVSASIMLIVATSNVLGWTLAINQIPQMISQAILSVTDNVPLILLLLNLFLLVVGSLMETASAIIILTPIFLGLIMQLGLDPLWFGLMASLNLVIGMVTPPIGVVLFVSSAINNVTIEKLVASIWPYILAAIAVLMIVTYVPSISLFLPKLVGLH